ncbi:MAG TPA: sodium:solute symporter family protein [Longimicrobiales bacterium]|nr:sodium:solute symporter family protein [Longimicrobiales bacterium]
MRLTGLDWAIILAYFALSAGIGLAFAKRAGKSMSEFFVSGRALPWWLAGTSMVATTFGADTPLAVTGMVASNGVAGNWLWWNMVMSGILTVFFYAHLWRRAEVLTDVEFAEIRYSGRSAALLRVFRALYLAGPINLIIMAWVNLAIVTVLDVALGIPPVWGLLFMFGLTLLYSTLSGLWGVVVTDLFQFTLAMVGSIVLAILSVRAVGGIDGMLARLPEHFGSAEAALAILPAANAEWMPATAFLAYLAVQWWATSYPGSEPGGGGYGAQRLVSAKTERDGMLATLWFNIAHFAIRPWPWILTALAVVILYPNLENPADGYVRAVVEILPPGLTGLMLAAFAAAYMSTIGTHLNWGASYLVNDVYVRFLKPDASEKQTVRASRLSTLLLFVLSLPVTYWLHVQGSIETAWRILIALGAGAGLVYILRWYWWRINAWSELGAMGVSLLTFVLLELFDVFDASDPLEGAQMMLTITAVSTIGWLAVTFMTRPTDTDKLHSFYRRVRPGGPGWRRVRQEMGIADEPIADGALSWVNWVAGVVSVYATLFGVGRVVFGDLLIGFAWIALAAMSFTVIGVNLGRKDARATS